MAFGLEVLTFGTFFMMASGLPEWCMPDKAPDINVTPTTEQVKYDYGRHSAHLGHLLKTHGDGHSPYEPGTKTITKGLHKARVNFKTNFKVSKITNRQTGEVCMSYTEVNVFFHVDPTIFITNQHPPGTCEHAAIKEHELKHLMADREVINDYSLWIGQAIQDDFNRYGYTWGPMPQIEETTNFQEMKDTLNGLVKPMIQEFSKDRQQRQNAIDSLEEYERVANMCKGGVSIHGHRH